MGLRRRIERLELARGGRVELVLLSDPYAEKPEPMSAQAIEAAIAHHRAVQGSGVEIVAIVIDNR